MSFVLLDQTLLEVIRQMSNPASHVNALPSDNASYLTHKQVNLLG